MSEGSEKEIGNVALGGRLRHARRLHKMTLRSVAAKISCSESMLSKIETGRVAPSLQMLARLAEVLGTSIAALFNEEQRMTVTVYQQGERQVMGLGSKRDHADYTVLERLIPYADGRLLNANLHVVPPGGGSNGTLSHPGEEVGFVIEGFVELIVDGKPLLLGAGSSFFFSSELPHSYRNIGTSIARIVWCNSPPY
ncbi:MAG: cupin protein [Rhizobium sp.]|nr:cupin protein [Rhizobium sp.]